MTWQSFSGNIFWDGEMRKGTLHLGRDGSVSFTGEPDTGSRKGTIVPAFINAHTHIGDSFIGREPEGDLAHIVGPNGFKHRMLSSVDDATAISGMIESIETMKRTGTASFIDFRESGIRGANMLRQADPSGKMSIILSRPSSSEEGRTLIKFTSGFGMSSVSDHDTELLRELREICRKEGRIFAIHFAEASEENEDLALSLSPDLIVHCIKTSDNFLDEISRRGTRVAITPRSNTFFGIHADYSRFLDHGIRLMIGTDNCMITAPDMFEEMDFLYRIQRSRGYIEPGAILRMATETPIDFLRDFNIDVPRSYIFYPGLFLSEYEIIVKGGHFQREILRTRHMD